jgi:hypothetical protein
VIRLDSFSNRFSFLYSRNEIRFLDSAIALQRARKRNSGEVPSSQVRVRMHAEDLPVFLSGKLVGCAAPLFRRDVCDRLGESPIVSGEILDRILSFPVWIVSGWTHYARSALFSSVVVTVNVIHSHHHRMRTVDPAQCSRIGTRR